MSIDTRVLSSSHESLSDGLLSSLLLKFTYRFSAGTQLQGLAH